MIINIGFDCLGGPNLRQNLKIKISFYKSTEDFLVLTRSLNKLGLACLNPRNVKSSRLVYVQLCDLQKRYKSHFNQQRFSIYYMTQFFKVAVYWFHKITWKCLLFILRTILRILKCYVRWSFDAHQFMRGVKQMVTDGIGSVVR